MQLRVGFDISSLPYNRGISRYTSNLVRALYAQRSEVLLRLFGSSLRQRDVMEKFVRETCPEATSRILPHPVKVVNILWNKMHVFSPEYLFGKLDVFHSWEMQPPLKKAALVSTIHDLAMLRFPKTADPYVLSMNELSWKHLKKEASALIAVSQSTRKDMIELLQIDPAKIFVVHEAMPQESRLTLSQTRQKEVLRQLGREKPYLFFIGTLEPRKNLKRLLEAWRPLKKEFELVLAGAAGWETIHQEEGVSILGSVTNEQLAALYGGASVLVYPSLYEGFGLPILDGFYHQVPVVTSNVSSMPEIAGDAAVLVEPKDVESIRKGIETAIHNAAHLREKGVERLKQFSWEKAAKQTLVVYRYAVEQKTGEKVIGEEGIE